MKNNFSEIKLLNEAATLHFGAYLATLCEKMNIIYLFGDLGAGKTTLCRGFLRGMGYSGKVKSPTYHLVEPYEDLIRPVYHFDLYRLMQAEELEFMGVRDYFCANALCLIEWPEKGAEFLPPPDVSLRLIHKDNARLAQITLFTNDRENIMDKLKTFSY